MSSLPHRPVSGSDVICNSPSLLLVDIVFIGLQLKVFKTRLLGRGFHTLISNALFPYLQPMWDLAIHPLVSPTSSLAHHPMSGSDTICNSPSLPLADIVFFVLPLKVFKMRLLRRYFHTLIRNTSFSPPTDVRSHNPPPLRAQRPR